MRARTSGLAVIMLLGFLLTQVVWIFTVPPFRASDEFDHAYRAAAVARGQWVAPNATATRPGTFFVTVPEDIVTAARPVCTYLPYTKRHDCWPASHVGDGMVTVASGAGQYNPLFYAVIGAPSLLFHGGGALYAMRVVASVLCAGMFWLALTVTARWARTRWPFVALAVACTPVLMYSAAMAAPNGLEILAGVTLWSALMGVIRARADVPSGTVAVAVVASSVLVTLRALGPLWCLLILLCVLLVATRRRELLRDLAGRRDVRVGLAVVIAFLVAALSWSASQKPIGSGSSHATLGQVREGLGLGVRSELGWLLQSVAVFPFRTQLAPLIVYPCAFALFLGLLAVGFRRAPSEVRITLQLMALTGLVLPIAFTALSYGPLHEVAWQGRYALPFILGLLVIAGSVIDASEAGEAPGWRLLGPVLLLFLLVQVPGPLKVLLNERATSPFAGTPAWPMPSPLVIGVLATLAALMMMWGAAGSPRATVRGSGTPERARLPAARETVPRR